MYVQDQFAVLGLKEQMLPATFRPGEPPALERLQRGVEGLQRGDVSGARPLDRRGSNWAVEIPA
jgi:hypothetical protein